VWAERLPPPPPPAAARGLGTRSASMLLALALFFELGSETIDLCEFSAAGSGDAAHHLIKSVAYTAGSWLVHRSMASDPSVEESNEDGGVGARRLRAKDGEEAGVAATVGGASLLRLAARPVVE